ncbi:hypothetical protein VTI28DRAFT_10379 [Corynascus sepedonium]
MIRKRREDRSNLQQAHLGTYSVPCSCKLLLAPKCPARAGRVFARRSSDGLHRNCGDSNCDTAKSQTFLNGIDNG